MDLLLEIWLELLQDRGAELHLQVEPLEIALLEMAVEIMSTVARGKTTRSPKSTMQENLQKRKDHNSDVAEKYDKLEALVLQLNEKISSMATLSLVASVPIAEKGSAETATAVVIS